MANLKVYSITSLAKMKNNPHYLKAKGGDIEEAQQLVEELFFDKNVNILKGNEILLPIVAQEASGRNKIPMAIAIYLSSEYGNHIETNIYQSVRANHTNSATYKRIRNVKFESKLDTCLEGNEYVIIDDHVTMGGTVASLAKFIREHGGIVNKVFSISNNTRQIKEDDGGKSINPRKEEIEECKRRFGDFFEILSDLKYEEMSSPTILQLLRFKNIDNAKERYKNIDASDDELTEDEKNDLWQEFNSDYLSFLFGK